MALLAGLTASTDLTEAMLSAGIVHITVGSKKTSFDVHRELLRAKSVYFSCLFLSEQLKKQADDKLHFSEYESEVFADFLSWLYSGKFIENEGNNASKSPSPTRPERVLHLLRLWTLATNFHTWSLQSLVEYCLAEAFRENKDALVDSKAVEYVYLNVPAIYKLRNLVVENWVERGNQLAFINCNKDLAREFLEDLIKAYMAKKETGLSITTSPLQSNNLSGYTNFTTAGFGGGALFANSTAMTASAQPRTGFGGVSTSATSSFGIGNYYADKVTVELRPT